MFCTRVRKNLTIISNTTFQVVLTSSHFYQVIFKSDCFWSEKDEICVFIVMRRGFRGYSWVLRCRVFFLFILLVNLKRIAFGVLEFGAMFRVCQNREIFNTPLQNNCDRNSKQNDSYLKWFLTTGRHRY